MGRKALPLVLDVTRADTELGGLDILVNNAGGTADLYDVQPPMQPAENVAKGVLSLLCDAPAEMRGQSILQF